MSNKAASKKQTGKHRRKKQSILPATDGYGTDRQAPEVGGDSLRNQPLENFPMKKLNLLKPEAMELSKLAAILCPGAETGAAMKRAIERAMKFYVEALLFVSDLPDDSEALMGYASDERWRERYVYPQLQSAKKRKSKKLRYAQEPDAPHSPMDEKWKKPLELRVGAVTDEAREYLSQEGCNWNDMTVIRKIRKLFRNPDELLAQWKRIDRTAPIRKELAILDGLLGEQRHDPSTRAKLEQRAQTVRQLLVASKPVEDGKTIYDIPLFVLDFLAEDSKARIRESKRESARKKTRKKLR